MNAHTQLHLGLGSFHRAHQALYMQFLHDTGDQSWRLVGGNIRPDMPELIAALQAQGGKYTLEMVNSQGERSYQRIESIAEVIGWDAELAGLTRVASDPLTRIISFTVTEAGYYLDTTDRLDLSYTDLKSDIAGKTCCTIYGALAKLLQSRMSADAGAITLLSCDNLRSNGYRFASGFHQYLSLSGQEQLKAWVEENTSTPNCMVDRITPRPSPAVGERVLAATGIVDAAAVMSETFLQWVIEDHFINGRPAWEKVGVEVVSDVMPYEEAKIRLLNATHSCIAWAGTLAGYSYIHEATQDREIYQFAYDYVTEDVIPVLGEAPFDLAEYRDVVLDRFSNPHILDTLGRVAMDGFSKIPGFIVPTIRNRLDSGESIAAVALLPALFLVFLIQQQKGEIPYPYEDQLMDPAVARAIATSADPVHSFCDERTLFNELAGTPALLEAMREAFAKAQAFLKQRTAR